MTKRPPCQWSTSTARMADALLREMHNVGLEQWIRDKRAEGRSWQRVARDLWAATDHVVDVDGTTVRRWVTRTAA